MEGIRMFLDFYTYNNFKVYQMDVKAMFLNGELEEVYIEQLDRFLLSEELDMVFRLKKALYGMKQAPRDWYARLDKYLSQQNSRKGTIDNNLYFKVE